MGKAGISKEKIMFLMRILVVSIIVQYVVFLVRLFSKEITSRKDFWLSIIPYGFIIALLVYIAKYYFNINKTSKENKS